MIKKILNRVKKVGKNLQTEYISYCKNEIDEKLVLLEGGQGTNINGNMFSMLNEICSNPRWSEYKAVFVVTQDTIDKAKKRMAFYGFDKVILSVRDSKQYTKYLATAKYLMTDNSFPPYFNKREEQVFLNTWHGTPLKTLGKSDKSNLASLANIQKNYLMSDYALFPNDFTKDVFMNDYDLKHIFSNKSIIANYPRNYIFYDKNQASEMKKKLGYEGKKLYAYMPTWRGTGRTADTKYQLSVTNDILKEFDKKLDDDTVLLVNLHFLLASNIDCSKYKHIDYFSGDYDTYEILNACDGLVTDYSSVFFDYAVTEKKIILFAYDKEKYLNTRGIYISFDELPFPIVSDVDGVIREMKTPVGSYSDFIEKYCPKGCEKSCELLFELMTTGNSSYYSFEQKNNTENICLIYAGSMPASQFENIKAYIKEDPGYDYVIAYRRNLNKEKKEFILSLDDDISTLGTVTAFQFRAKELIELSLARAFMYSKTNKTLDNFFEREKNRLFYSVKPVKVVDFSCSNMIIGGILTKMTGEKEFVNHGKFICNSDRNEKTIRFVKKLEKANGFKSYEFGEKEDTLFKKLNEDGFADITYRRNSRMKNIFPLYFSMKKGKSRNLVCLSMFSLKTVNKVRLKDTYLTVGDNKYKPRFFAFTSRNARKHRGIYMFTIPVKDVVDMPATNQVALNYKNDLGCIVPCHIIYNSVFLNLFFGLRGPLTIDDETDTVAIFRQSKKNRLNVYVRSSNVSDRFSKRFLQMIAFVASLFWFGKKANKLVLLYEKNSSKYEESASVTFEKLIDSGYKNAYFIIDKNYEYIDRIAPKYRNNILYKNTFKHYLYFFKAKSFIGTEALVHAIDLKTFNKLALMKVADPNKNYVFLQHGVMYMVSLDSESRGMFKRKNLKGKYRVVVSSQAEADHFTDLGNHEPSDLYICGLPKFDRNTLNEDADKIVIMPTWRPWEINLARDDFESTGYYKMIMKIYKSVPKDLRDKVIILPHPLIVNELNHIDGEIAQKVTLGVRYDDILKQARVLITDYSSIAYDAFYRGTRVIFYWEEKDYCMSQYGPSTKLMLNEENVYGDYFYNTDGLMESIKDNYDSPQSAENIKKYREIVTYHDGKNTERLLKFLKKDKII